MPFCPEKGQKGAKVGGAVGKNQLFCCIKLESIKGYKLPQTPFCRKILIFRKNGTKGPKIGK